MQHSRGTVCPRPQQPGLLKHVHADVGEAKAWSCLLLLEVHVNMHIKHFHLAVRSTRADLLCGAAHCSTDPI